MLVSASRRWLGRRPALSREPGCLSGSLAGYLGAGLGETGCSGAANTDWFSARSVSRVCRWPIIGRAQRACLLVAYRQTTPIQSRISAGVPPLGLSGRRSRWRAPERVYKLTSVLSGGLHGQPLKCGRRKV